MRVYFLPGLGADKRMYKWQLSVVPDMIVLEHLPVIKGESLKQYAQRFVPLIDTSEPFSIVGTSMGGMVAVELSQVVNAEKVILLSTVKQQSEIPVYMKLLKRIPAHRLLSGDDFKRLNGFLARRLDDRGDKEVADLIKQMTIELKSEFAEWAIDAIINWNPPVKLPGNIIHIQGTNDQLFSHKRIPGAVLIERGTHVMNMSKSKEVNAALAHALATTNGVKVAP